MFWKSHVPDLLSKSCFCIEVNFSLYGSPDRGMDILWGMDALHISTH
jgi:hypothetical protein